MYNKCLQKVTEKLEYCVVTKKIHYFHMFLETLGLAMLKIESTSRLKFFEIFLPQKKKKCNNSLLANRVACCLHQSDRHIRVCISHQSDRHIRVCIAPIRLLH